MPSAAGPAPAADRGKVELLHQWEGADGASRSMVALARRYQELRPDVSIVQTIVSGGAYERRQSELFASGMVPDLTVTDAEHLPAWADRSALIPLDEHVRRDRIDPRGYFDLVTAACSWRGRLYGMIHHPSVRSIVFRNVPLMEAAGLDAGREPRSWDDLRDWGQRLAAQDGGTIARLGWVPTWTETPAVLQFPRANGAGILDESGRVVRYTTPPSVEALGYLVDALWQLDGGPERVDAWAGQQPRPWQWSIYGQGRLGLVVGGDWYLDQIHNIDRNADAMRSAISPLPGGPSAVGREVLLGGGSSIAVVRGARRSDAGWEYAAWVAGPEGQAIVQDVGYAVAGLRQVARDPRVLAERPWQAAVVGFVERTTELAHLSSPVYRPMEDALLGIQSRLSRRRLSAVEAAAEAQTTLQGIVDRYWREKG